MKQFWHHFTVLGVLIMAAGYGFIEREASGSFAFVVTLEAGTALVFMVALGAFGHESARTALVVALAGCGALACVVAWWAYQMPHSDQFVAWCLCAVRLVILLRTLWVLRSTTYFAVHGKRRGTPAVIYPAGL